MKTITRRRARKLRKSVLRNRTVRTGYEDLDFIYVDGKRYGMLEDYPATEGVFNAYMSGYRAGQASLRFR